MCYHVSTPERANLNDYLKRERAIRGQSNIMVDMFEPYYHVSGFAHPELPIITGNEPDRVQQAIWGYIPFFAKTHAEANDFMNKTLNAKTETAWTTPMYRAATPKHRCLIMVDGFFEWRWDDVRGKTKVPHYIYMPDKKPFALGGLWGDWADPETGELIRTCSIYTTEANELMATIHNNKKRMPLVVPEDSWEAFISPDTERKTVEALMRPFPDGNLQAHEVSKLITDRSRDSNVRDVQESI